MKWLLDTFARWFWAALEWLQQAGFDIVHSLMSTVSQYFPNLGAQLSSHAELLDRVNVFFPATETVSLASVYFGLWCVVNAAKIGKWFFAAKLVRSVVGGS